MIVLFVSAVVILFLDEVENQEWVERNALSADEQTNLQCFAPMTLDFLQVDLRR